MEENRKRRIHIWPIIFLSAFFFGAILWALWMSKVIRQTRHNRENNFFVPHSNALPPGITNPAPPATNPPVLRTNSPP
ncbi:MAG: hypothetical protein JWR26_2546 [Pedosphaera sp.]|nr:hypothetical protein [Pedosphaera sp.]